MTASTDVRRMRWVDLPEPEHMYSWQFRKSKSQLGEREWIAYAVYYWLRLQLAISVVGRRWDINCHICREPANPQRQITDGTGGKSNKYNTNGEINLKVEKKKSSLRGKKRTERWTYSGNDIGRLFNFKVIIAKANTGTLLNSECKVPWRMGSSQDMLGV